MPSAPLNQLLSLIRQNRKHPSDWRIRLNYSNRQKRNKRRKNKHKSNTIQAVKPTQLQRTGSCHQKVLRTWIRTTRIRVMVRGATPTQCLTSATIATFNSGNRGRGENVKKISKWPLAWVALPTIASQVLMENPPFRLPPRYCHPKSSPRFSLIEMAAISSSSHKCTSYRNKGYKP